MESEMKDVAMRRYCAMCVDELMHALSLPGASM